jgi:hypothetical protein
VLNRSKFLESGSRDLRILGVPELLFLKGKRCRASALARDLQQCYVVVYFSLITEFSVHIFPKLQAEIGQTLIKLVLRPALYGLARSDPRLKLQAADVYVAKIVNMLREA